LLPFYSNTTIAKNVDTINACQPMQRRYVEGGEAFPIPDTGQVAPREVERWKAIG
jgi:hypothetical protein